LNFYNTRRTRERSSINKTKRVQLKIKYWNMVYDEILKPFASEDVPEEDEEEETETPSEVSGGEESEEV